MDREVEATETLDMRSLVAAVAEGESITILLDGKAVAKLIKTDVSTDRSRAELAMKRIEEISANLTLGPDLTIRELIEDGRRY